MEIIQILSILPAYTILIKQKTNYIMKNYIYVLTNYRFYCVVRILLKLTTGAWV